MTNAAWYVSPSGNDSNSCSVPASPCLTINGAISKAISGDVIFVATGTYTGSGSQVVLINESVTLSGGWSAGFISQSGLSTIDGQNARQGVYVNSNITASLGLFIVKNGSNSGGSGGGVYNSGNLTISNSSIQNNSATNGTGGGVYNNKDLTITNSSVQNNSAYNSAGIFTTNGSLTLNNTTISNNIASYYGGGVYYNGSLTANNATISNNIASYGGGIYRSSGSASFKNSILAGNTATSSGPRLFWHAHIVWV